MKITLKAKMATRDMKPADMSVDQLRAAYQDAVDGLTYDGCATKDEVVVAMKAKLTAAGRTEPTPVDFVRALRSLSFTCRRCAGTGQFITMVVNGKPTGPGGECFRCNGKGSQRWTDGIRNLGADLHRPVYQ